MRLRGARIANAHATSGALTRFDRFGPVHSLRDTRAEHLREFKTLRAGASKSGYTNTDHSVMMLRTAGHSRAGARTRAPAVDYAQRLGAAWWPLAVAMLAALLAAPLAQAADALTTFNPNLNGTVNAIAYGDGVTYLGGSFSSVSYNSGSMARLDETTGLPDPNFPQVTNGLVDHILADGAGGWSISGEFTTVAGVTRNHIAHILPNETLDPNFNPNADNRVYNLKLIGSTLYCAGMFANIGGAARSKIAAIDATTGIATSWNPGGAAGTNGTIIWGLDSDGTSIYVGGDFTSINGTTRNEIAAINIASGALSSWNPNANSTVYWILYNPGDGLVYVGGQFSTIGGATRNDLAAITAAGAATAWNPNLNGAVWHIIISSSKVLYAAGSFTTVNGGSARGYIAAWDVSTATTGAALAWNPNANGIVWWSAPVGTTLYIGGQFTTVGGQTRNYIAAVDQGTGLATTWTPSASAQVYTLTTDASSVLAGGPFTAVSAGRSNVVAVQSSNGAILPFNPGVTGTVDSLLLSGTTLYVGGALTAVGATAITDLAAIDTTSGALTGFAPALNGAVDALALSGTTLYAGGAFTTASGSTRNRAAAWSTSSGALAAWNPNCNNTVDALAIDGADVLLGGAFTTLGGATVTRLGMTDQVNGTSTGFNGNCNNTVQSLWVGPAMFYAGGAFTTASGSTRNHAAAWDLSNNALDATWNPNLTGTTVLAIGGYLNDLFLGGTFTKVGATTLAELASVSPTTGAVNAAFAPAPTPTTASVTCLDVNSAAPLFTLFVGGSFTAMGGTTRDEAASFDLDQAPTALALSAATVANNSANGTVIGAFTPTDPNPNDTFTYTLSSSAGGLFGISGNQLVVANTSVFTSPPPASYSITAVVTDADGQSFSQAFTITDVVVKQTPVITWAAPAAIVYGAALGAAQLDATANVPGTFAYTPAAGAVLAAGTQTLSVTFTPTDTTDYSLANATTTVVVTKAPLTVTANNASRIFNTPNPTFTASFSGFVNGDTASSLGGTLTFATTAIQTSPKGTYPITPSGLTSPNYTIAYVNGTLTIATAAPTVTWGAPASIVYGTALSATQLDATASVPGTFAYTPAAGTVLHVGASQVLSVTFTPTDTVNYTTVASNQSITVTTAALTVAATSVSRLYNTANPTLGVTYSGFVNGDSAASLGGALTVTTTAIISSPIGGYPITASGQTSHDYAITYVAGTLTVTQAAPVLTWANPAAITYGTALSAAQLDATASVPGTFAYTPVAGTVLAAGTQTLHVTFTPTDSTDYTTATTTATLVVNQAAPVLTWANPAAITYGTALSATQLDATASVPGTFAYTPVAGTVLGAGTQTLHVTFTPTDSTDYTSATTTATLVVNQAAPVLTWANPAAITYGTALGATQLDATASVPGTFAYTPVAGTVLGAGTQTLHVTFTPTDCTDYTAAATTATLVVNQAAPVLTWANPAAITYGTALGATQLDATASTAGTFAYTPVAGTVLGAGTQTLHVTFTPTDGTDYTTATTTATLVVNQAAPVLTWANPAAITYGTALGATQLDATASVPGTFAYTPVAGTVLGAGTQTLHVTFTPTDGTDYTTATTSATLVVNQAAPVLTWANPAAITYGTALGATQLDATASVPGTFAYTPVAGTVLGAGTQTLHVTFTPTDGTDYTTATTTATLVVNQAAPVLTWANPAAITYGTALSATQLDASASTAGTFAYTPVAGTVLGAGTQTLHVTFTPTDGTDYTTATTTATLVVNQAAPVLTWANPAAITYGTALSATQLDATASVPGTFAYLPVAGTVLGAGTQTLHVTFTPTDGTDYTTATATATLVVNQATPVLTWANPAAIIYGTALSATQLDATASTAGAFVYAPAAGTVLAAGTQTLHVTFTPTDSTDYTPATTTATLVVNQAAPVLTWANPAAITYGTALSATQLDATASVPGTFAYAPVAGTVLGAGTQTLHVTFTPTDNTDYAVATTTATLVVSQAAPVLTWANPAAITYGTALSATQLDATASTAGTFVYAPVAGTVLGAGTQTLHVTFTPTDSTDYTTATATATLVVNKATPTVTWANPAAITYGTALGATQLDATASTAGTFVYAPVAGTVLGAGSQTLSVTFTPTDATDYTTATATATLVVNKATPTVTWANPAAITYGTALSATHLDATASTAGTFVYAPVAGTVLGTGTQTLHVTFTPTDGTDYAAATSTATLVVNQAAPVLTWANPAAITYGTALSATQLDATASVPGTFAYTPVAGTVLAAGTQILHVTFTPTDGTDYAAATTTATLVVNQAAPVLTWANPAAITYGTALSATQLDATASVPGTFAYAPVAGTVLGAGTQTLHVTFTPTDGTDYTTASTTATLVVNQAAPVLTWANPAAITYGTALGATQLDATASVPGIFAYAPVAGTVLGAGTQTLHVTFTPTDSTDYASATATATLVVNQAAPVLTWANPTAITYGTALSATQLDATASVPGTFAYAPVAGTVLGAGTQTLHVTFTPTDSTDYASATATATLVVNQAAPVLTWANPTAITYGTALSATQLDATASVPGTFAYAPVAGTVLGAGTQTLHVTFTPTDSTDYASATATATLVVNKAAPTVTWANPAAITYGAALSATQLDATASVPGTFVYAPVSGTVLGAGTQTLHVTFTPTDSTDYATATATATLVVNQAAPVLTWANPAAITYGTALSATQLDATANVPGTFAYTPVAGTVLGAGTQTLHVTFTPTDSTDYAAATTTATLVVNQAAPVLTWANPAAITYGTALGATQLDATASTAGTFAYTPTAGTVLGTGTHTLSVTFTPTDGTDYTSASTTATLVVNKATPVLTWANPAAITFGTALGATQLDASANTAGTFVYAPAAGTVLGAGSQTLSVTFTPTDSTDYTAATATATLVVNKVTPTVTWANPAAITFGAALGATQLDATASTAGTFVYSPAAGTVLGAGTQTLTVTFTPTDSADYTAATGSATLVVNQAAPVLTWANPAAITYGTALSATQLDATASVPGTFAYAPVAGTILGAGTQTLHVTFTPTDSADYASATATATLVVNQATPDLTWANPAAITYGAALGATQLDATASVPGTFAYAPVAGTVLAAGTQTLHVTFTPTDGTDYTSATATATLVVNQSTPTVTWAAPANIVYGTTLTATQLDATASVPGTFAYVPSLGTALHAGASQVLSVTFTPTDSVDYAGVTAHQNITVTTAALTVTATSFSRVYNTTNPALGVTYNGFVNGDNATSLGGSLSISTTATTSSPVGGYPITATGLTSLDYAIAYVAGTLTVTQAVPVLTWANPAAITYGTALGATQLNAAANVPGTFAYAPVAGTVLGAGTQTLHVTFTPTDGADYTTATTTATLVVNQATPVLTWANPAAITYGVALSATQLDATANTAGAFVYAPAAGTVLGAGTQTLHVTFTPTDGTDYTSATATATVVVNQAAPILTWANPAAITYGTALGATQLDATANVPGSFAYTPVAGTVLAAGTQTLHVTFTPTDGTDYASATTTATLVVNQAAPVLTWANPAAITYSTALSATQLDATANVPGTFAYTPVAGTVLAAGTQTLHVTFTPTDGTDYTTATTTATLVVNQAAPVLTWANPAAITYGTALSATQLDATASVPGTFAYVPVAGTVLGAGTQTLHVSFTPTDGADYTTATTTATLVVNQATPVLTWANPAAITYGVALSATQLDATANTAGAFVYAPAAGTVLGAGTQTLHVTFTPTDGTDYTTATATATLVVNQAAPVLTWANPAAITYGTALGATQLDATASVPGTFAYAPVAGTVLGAGTQTLHVSFTPTDGTDYTTATATATLVVNQAAPVLTWANPAAITYGTALGATQLDASANVPGTFAYTPVAGTVLGAGTQTLHVTFTPTDSTDYAAATTTATLVVNQAAPVLTWANPAAITYGTALGATQLDASANVPGTFAYTPVAGTVLSAGTQTLHVTFTPTDGTDYTSAAATATLVVNQAAPVLTWANPAAITYGTALSATQLDATANVPGTFAYLPVAGTILGAGTQTLHVTFTPTDGADYTTATTTATLVVNQATPGLTWANPAAITYGVALSATQLDATASVPGTFVYTPAAGTVLGAGTQTLHVSFTPTDGTDYTSATATATVVVNQAAPVLTWANPAAITFGTALSATQLDATASVPGTFAYAPVAGTVLGAGTQTLHVTFTPTDSTDYASATATATLVVNQAAPVLTWANPAAITYGTALGATQLDATASVPGTFAYAPVAGTVLGAGTQTLHVTFTPTDSADYASSTATATLVVNQAAPVLTWANPAAITYGTALGATQLDATASVPGTFAYAPVSGTVLAAGTQTLHVTFTPTDSADYASATATATLVVNQAAPVLTWANPAAITYGTALGATQLDATASVPGTFAYVPVAGTVLGAGSHTLTVTFTPTDSADYASAAATATLVVNQAAPVLTWANPAAITYGTALGATQLDATASVPGTFAYVPAAGTVLGAGSHTLTVTFTPTDSADYASATATATLVVNQATPVLTWANPAAITYGTALGATQLDAMASTAGSFAYTPAAGTVLVAGSQTLHVTFTPTDGTDYTTATATATLVVNQAAPVLTWANPAAITYGVALSATQLDATASVPGTFVYTPAAGTALGAGTQTLHVSFTPTDGTDYTSATATATVVVNQAAPVLTWANPAAITFGTALSATQLDATASTAGTFVYAPVAGTVLGAGSQTLSVTFTPTDSADYTAATATATLVVNKATPVLTWANPAAITYGAALSATQLDATASTAGTFVYAPVAGTVLGAGSQTLSVTFTPTDSTDYTAATATATLVVNKAAPVLTWANPAAITYGAALSATQLDATASTAGTFVYAPTAGTVLGAGSQTLSVTFTPTDSTDYTTATATATLVVNKAAPVLTWANPAAITYGAALGATQLDASASTAGTFVYAPAAGTVLGAGSQTLSVTFTPTDSADYTPATATATVLVNQATPVLTWANPAAITYGTALGATQLDASASVPGTFAYAPVAGTVLGAGSQTLHVTFTPTDSADYATAATTATVVVNKATPVLTWANPAAITYGTALSAAQLDATASTAGTFAYAPAAGTVLGAGTQTLHVTFTPTDGADYTSATATATLVVNQATPVLTWANPAAITYGVALSATQLDATANTAGAFVYTPAAGTVLGAGTQTLHVSFTPTDSTDYTAAAATSTLVVNQATPTVTWANPAAITYGTALSATQLDATASVPGTFAYNPVAGTVLGAGTQTLHVTFTPTDGADYTTATGTASLVVNKATPTVTWANPAAITYGTALGATQLDATASVPGTFAYAPAAGTVLGAGTQTLHVTFTPTDSADYASATATATLVVNQATPVLAWANPAAITYGTALGATQLDATASVPGTFAYAPAAGTVLAAGTQTLHVSFTPTDGTDYAAAAATATVVVNKATPTVTWAAPANIVYGAALSATQLDATASVPGTFAYAPAAGTVLHAGAAQVLSVTFTPTDAVDYNGAAATTAISVTPAPLTVTATSFTRAYGAANPSLTVAYAGFVNGDSAASLSGSASLSTTATINSLPGSYPIAVVQGTLADANYSFTFVNGAMTVTKAVLTVAANNLSKAYGAALPPLTYTISGYVLGQGAAVVSGAPTLTTTALKTSAVAAYPITITQNTLSAANYTFAMVNGTLTITPVPLTVTAANKSMVYGAAVPAFTVTYAGFVNGDTQAKLTGAPAMSSSATSASPVGSYPITVTVGTLADANYAFVFVNGALSVTPATLTVTAANATKVYGAALPAFSATYAGFKNGDTTAVLGGAPALATAATSASPVGSYTITAALGTLTATNYIFAFKNGTLTVTKAALTVTATSQTMTYGSAVPALTYGFTGFVNGDTAANITGAPTLTTTAKATSAVGAYPITIKAGTLAATNYTFTLVNGTMTVAKAVLDVTASNASRAYGAANPAFSVNYTGFVNGDTSAVVSGKAAITTVATAASPAGSYAIVPALGTLKATNYSFAFVNGTLTVTKATVTVTANAATRTYGASDPAFTVKYTGFLNGDTAAVLSGAPSFTTTATIASPVGAYTVSPGLGTLTAVSYTFAFVNGPYTITKATLTVTAAPVTRPYGSANPVLTDVLTGFLNGDNASVVSGKPTLTTAVVAATPVGSYPITVAVGTLAATHYAFVAVSSSNFTVAPATLDVNVASAARAYGAANPAFTYTLSGFVLGQNASLVHGAPALSTSATLASPAGSYPIGGTAGSLSAPNYAFTIIPGMLTVGQSVLTVSADVDSVYGSAPVLVPSYSGFLNGDTAAVITGTPTLTSGVTATSPVGVYVVTVSGSLTAANYTFSYVSGTVAVTPAALAVIGCDTSMVTGGAVPPLSATYAGFVNGETSAVLSGSLSVTTTATSSSAPGTYPVAPNGVSDANYDITFADGSLAVLGVTTRASVASDGSQLVGDSALGAISGNGAVLVFTSDATNLPNAIAGTPQVYVRQGGVVSLVSTKGPGGQAALSDSNT